jgi:putative FmdB family regulatory protein
MMPHYDYECPACGAVFEEFRKSMLAPEKDLTKCPECGTRARREIGKGAAVLFYGPGFYATDSRTIKDAQTEATKKRIAKKKRISVPVTDRRGRKKKK